MRSPILMQSLYENAPFPTTNTTNYGGVRLSTNEKLLAIVLSKFDNVRLYTICGYDE
jgi:hypothetical protein